MNRTLRAAGATFVVGALIGGCSSSSGSSAPTTAPQPSAAAPSSVDASGSPSAAPTKSNVTIEVLASQDWIKTSEQDLAGKFEEQIGIHLDFQIIPSAQDFDVLKTKLNSGEGHRPPPRPGRHIVLTILPVILIYVVAQRWIVSGVSAGAVKA